MFDNRLLPRLLGNSVVILDHVALGQIIADWATGARPLPGTAQALRQQLAGVAEVNPAVREVSFERASRDRLVIRLPDASEVEAACDALADPWAGARYPFPRFYVEALDRSDNSARGTVLSPLELLHARIADHAIAQCP